MNIRALLEEQFLDSPTLASDLGTLISPVRLGIWTTVLNALTCFAAFICINIYSRDAGMSEQEALELGQLLSIVLLGCIGAFYTIFVPIRTCGLFMGPRSGKYFDQIVLSGISPFRYMIGKVVAQNVFFAMIILFLVPYFVLVLFLGGIDLGFLILSIVLLMVYVNLLALATLWLSVYITEAAAALAIIVVVGPLYLYGFNVADEYNPMLMTPAVTFAAPIFEVVHSADQLSRPYWLFGGAFLGIAALFGGLALVHLVIGPLPGIVRANSTFGEIVFKGDAKRKSALRKRLALQRAAQLLFFYENRPGWANRLELRVRWGTIYAGLIIVTVAAYGVLFRLADEFNRQEYNIMIAVIAAISMLLGCVFFCETLNTETTPVQVSKGRFWRAGSVDTVFAMLFFPIPLVLGLVTLLLQESYFMPQRWKNYRATVTSADPTTWFVSNFEVLAIIGVVMLSFYAFFRWQTMKSWYRGGIIAVSLIIYAVFFCFLPVFPLVVIKASEHVYPGVTGMEPLFEHVAMLSPLMAIATSMGEGIRGYHFSPAPFCILLHLLVAVIAARLAVNRHRRLVKTIHGAKQPAKAAPGRGAETPQPDPEPVSQAVPPELPSGGEPEAENNEAGTDTAVAEDAAAAQNSGDTPSTDKKDDPTPGGDA